MLKAINIQKLRDAAEKISLSIERPWLTKNKIKN
jgi:hypothetical protein